MGVAPKPALLIDSLSRHIGSFAAWMMPAMALLTLAIVVLRYGFSIGAIAAQELVLYLHGAGFLLGASYTLLTDQHVRVDIFYRRFTERQQSWVNAVGHVMFTLPLCALLVWGSFDYVATAWKIREHSPEPGGLPGVYLLKTLIPAMGATLALQAISQTLKSVALLTLPAATDVPRK